MTTINISLPDKLKSKAQELIEEGFYSSFSDLVRHSIRETINSSKYDLLFKEAKRDLKEGKATVLKTDKDIEKFVKSL